MRGRRANFFAVPTRYVERGRYTTENLRSADGTLMLADDYEDADGLRILNFARAQQAARGPRGRRRSAESYTVGDAIKDYLRFLENLTGMRRAPSQLFCAASSLTRLMF